MTEVIYKYPLRPWSIFIDIPRDANILSAGAQKDDIVVWAAVNPAEPLVSRLVAAHPTGIRIPFALRGAQFVGTVQMDDGLVFHIFDGGEEKCGK